MTLWPSEPSQKQLTSTRLNSHRPDSTHYCLEQEVEGKGQATEHLGSKSTAKRPQWSGELI